MPRTTLVMGYMASGKSGQATALPGTYLNRDKKGGKVIDLTGVHVHSLEQGEDVVLDNTFPTIKSRQPFIEIGRRHGPVDCVWVKTSLEDAQVNALHRMWERHGQVFLDPPSLKPVQSDPNMFPVAALFRYRKSFEKPTKAEGFDSITTVPFVRKPKNGYDNSAVIFDYDGTLRDVPATAKYKFPTKPEEVVIMSGRKDKLQELKANNTLILGVSNQSGIARKQFTQEAADECFARTNELLDIDIDVVYCPHGIPPTCYCRKPQSGLGVLLIERYKLDPAKCVFVGDQTTDRTFAKRVGFQYVDQKDYF